MPSWKTMFESNTEWLSAADMDDDGTRTLTIDHIEQRGIESDKGVKGRPVAFFRERVKPWVTCSTTCQCIEAMYGSEIEGWAGKPITLFWDPTVTFGREIVGGVRVKGAPGLGQTMTATIILPKKRPQKVKLIDTTPRDDRRPKAADDKPAPPADPLAALAELLDSHGLTVADLDQQATDGGKLPPSTMDSAGLARVVGYLRTEPGRAKLNDLRASLDNGGGE